MATDEPLTSAEADLLALVKLSALGSDGEARLFLNRLIGKYRTDRPELSRQLDAVLIAMRKKDGMGGVLR